MSREGCSSDRTDDVKEKGTARVCKRGGEEGRWVLKAEQAGEDEKGLGGEGCRVWEERMKLEETLERDNEAAHECRNEWALFTIANSDPSGLPDLHLARRLIHATSQPPS